MDIGKFKASRARLILWIIVPPMIFTGACLSAYALRLQAEWELNRARLMSNVLPELAQTQREARDLLKGLQQSDAFSIQSEDELIGYIREIERKSEFIVDTLEVERESSGIDMSVLNAVIKGEGSFEAVERFMSDIGSGQHLLFANRLEISKSKDFETASAERLTADITFELILLDSLKTIAGEGE